MNAKQANRAQRRAAERALPKVLRGTDEEIYARWAKNGITKEDLEATRNEYYHKGMMDGLHNCYKGFYAGILLAAKEIYGFGQVRGMRLLQGVYDRITQQLDNDSAQEEVFEKLRIKIHYNDAITQFEYYRDVKEK